MSQYQQQRHNNLSYKQDVTLYSTATDVLVSLLLDLIIVAIESSIFLLSLKI